MKSQKIVFSLAAIDTVQFATLGNVPNTTDNLEETIALSFKILEASHIIDCIFGYTLFNSKTPFLTIQATCSFKINKKDFEKLLNSSTFKIPVSFAQHITMLTVGTTRGILHSKTENTPFNAFPISLIDLDSIINEDILINISIE
ncbi:hypothetical protein ACFX5U_20380 [Sphingobacterium sp. SG20118]|uniref:hypothetical protein n=1 Tax=Sphingobacterium sp. SG20118 TaxID=3367156 RepID=UPI0037DFBE1E